MKRTFIFVLLATLFVLFAAQAQHRTGNTRDPRVGASGSSEKPSRSSEGRAPATVQTPAAPIAHNPSPEYPVRPHPVFPVIIGGTPSVPVQTVIVVEQPVYVMDDETPEVTEVVLHDRNSKPGNSGFDFSSEDVLFFNDIAADMYFSIGEQGPEFIVGADADIQSYGNVPFSGLSSPPSTDWLPLHRVYAEPDNVYILWTWDNQFYKFRVNMLAEDRISIEWNKMNGGARIASNEDYRNGKDHRDTSTKFDR